MSIFYQCSCCGRYLESALMQCPCRRTSALMEVKNMDGQTLSSGKKKDEGKPRWELIAYEVIAAVSRILTGGAVRYTARNWEQGIAYGRVFGAAMRHLSEWWTAKLFGGDGINHADGSESHLDHAICELMFLSAYEKRGLNGTNFDDRPTNLRSTPSNQSSTL